MDIIQIGAIGIVSTILALSIKKQSPEFSLLISIAAGVIIFIMVIPKFEALFQVFNKITSSADIDLTYISIVIKIIGIAYISQFSSQICIDAGESAIASKIELAGKILIMVISAPILLTLVELVVAMIP